MKQGGAIGQENYSLTRRYVDCDRFSLGELVPRTLSENGNAKM